MSHYDSSKTSVSLPLLEIFSDRVGMLKPIDVEIKAMQKL
jgi:hypothetical protein